MGSEDPISLVGGGDDILLRWNGGHELYDGPDISSYGNKKSGSGAPEGLGICTVECCVGTGTGRLKILLIKNSKRVMV